MKKKLNYQKEKKEVNIGLITESFSNGMFKVHLYKGKKNYVLGYVSGKIRYNSIKLLKGDKVKIEISKYDPDKGRIIYRLK
uniref:Translation initiation factor IF-1 n=1 Tax=Mitrastemon kanehirai TaxID=1358725 RepID=A0A4Y1MCB9_9ERIC|nr:translational initiation factor 1 [Mitrastemon yamamotoi]AWS06645.1 translational initiation factor 1 [Mitrastemon kanehirai]USS58001.1 translational initiation factor 1 [Mitrastemon yamamotoi]